MWRPCFPAATWAAGGGILRRTPVEANSLLRLRGRTVSSFLAERGGSGPEEGCLQRPSRLGSACRPAPAKERVSISEWRRGHGPLPLPGRAGGQETVLRLRGWARRGTGMVGRGRYAGLLPGKPLLRH